MSAIKGALVAALGLIAEEVLVTAKGGSAAISGAFGSITKTLDDFADPTVAAIPDLADKKTTTTPAKPPIYGTGGAPGAAGSTQTGTSGPAGPAGPQGPFYGTPLRV